MSYKLDFAEPIIEVVQRLETEHKLFRNKVERIQREVQQGNIPVALSLLTVLRSEVLRHAVEEEAVIAREIMKNFKRESGDSVRVLQEHRRITSFFNGTLPTLSQTTQTEAQKKILEFSSFLLKHHSEEESIVFPLALYKKSSPNAKHCNHTEVSDFGFYYVRNLYGKLEKLLLEKCCDCGTYLTTDGIEVPNSCIEKLPNERTLLTE